MIELGGPSAPAATTVVPGAVGHAGTATPPVLIAAGRHDDDDDAVWSALLELAINDPVGASSTALDGTGLDGTGAVALAASGTAEATAAMRALLERGHEHLVVVPLDRGAKPMTLRPSTAALAAAVDEIRAAYPRAMIHDLGRPVDPAASAALADLLATPQHGPTALLAGSIARGFDGDPARLGRFISALRAGLPDETTIVLRGSAVAGRSYRRGTPFDADGPGTSDLDVVAVGEAALGLWVPEAALLGGINTLPLSDHSRWVAPRLDGARRKAQAIARRPLSIQAMAGWFLELRAIVQRQPYVVLTGPS